MQEDRKQGHRPDDSLLQGADYVVTEDPHFKEIEEIRAKALDEIAM